MMRTLRVKLADGGGRRHPGAVGGTVSTAWVSLALELGLGADRFADRRGEPVEIRLRSARLDGDLGEPVARPGRRRRSPPVRPAIAHGGQHPGSMAPSRGSSALSLMKKPTIPHMAAHRFGDDIGR